MAVADELAAEFREKELERQFVERARLREAEAAAGRGRPRDVRWLAKRIEHAVLAPQATEDDVAAGARVALRWGVRALVVKPCHVNPRDSSGDVLDPRRGRPDRRQSDRGDPQRGSPRGGLANH